METKVHAIITHQKQFIGAVDIDYDIRFERDPLTEEPMLYQATPLRAQFTTRSLKSPPIAYWALQGPAKEYVDQATQSLTLESLDIPFEEALDEILAQEERARELGRSRP